MSNNFLGNVLSSIARETRTQKSAEKNFINAIAVLLLSIVILYVANSTDFSVRSRITMALYYGSIIALPASIVIIISSIIKRANAMKARKKLVNHNTEMITDFMKSTKFGHLENVALHKQVAPLGIELYGHWSYLDQVEAAKARKVIPQGNAKKEQQNPEHKPSLEEWKKQNPGKGLNEYFQKYGAV